MITASKNQAGMDKNASQDSFDVDRIRRDFPILQQTINGRPLVYLDNAATSQKPSAVIDAMRNYYECDNANIHRGVHTLSVRATAAYELVRTKVRDFIGAEMNEEIIFLRGTTEAINFVAQTYGRSNLARGDEILITWMEHHSNIVPWQLLCEQTGALLRVAPINDDGEVVMDEFHRLLGPRTKIVAVTHVSNALGTINPVSDMIGAAHDRGIPIVLDGAQAVPHVKVNVKQLDCDFYAFSSHKMFGPTGIGALYGKRELLEQLQPYQGGGEMIKSVTFEGTSYNNVPHKFEAGTPNIAGVVGFGAAIDYVCGIGLDRIAAHESVLLAHTTRQLASIPQVRLVGTAGHKAAVVSFVLDGVHAHDVGTVLDQMGIAVRTGHHCCQPVMQRFGVTATTRASMAFYNTLEEVEALADGVREVVKVFS
ncbi:MAG: SufS family cysteine desulfurase [Phycisphaerae bacterium]